MNDIRYLQFPLMMLRQVHKDFNKGMADIFSWSIVNFALKQEVTEADAARQLIYDFYKNKEAIPGGIYATIAGIINEDEDYSGFRGEGHSFNPDEEIEDLLPELRTNPELREFAIRNCQIQKAGNFLEVSGADSLTWYKHYLKVQADIDKHEKRFGRDPYPTIELKLLWDLKEEADPIIFAAYIAIRSLQGQYNYTKTDKPTIVGRMVGAKKRAILDTFEDMQPLYEKYSKRYHFDSLITRLIRRGLVKGRITQKHWSKFVISTRLDFMQLAEAYGERLSKDNIKAQEQAARKRLQQVYNTTSI